MSHNRKRERLLDDKSDVIPKVTEDEVVMEIMNSALLRQRERDEHLAPKHQKKRRQNQESSGNKNWITKGDSSHSKDLLNTQNEEDTPIDKIKPNFALSGAFSSDQERGSLYKGVLLKFSEPPEARAPNTRWRLYVFKGEETIETLHVSKQSAYLFGRNEEISDITLRHGSCSSQHAVLQYRALPNKETGKLNCCPYLMDLESTNGTFINGKKLDPARYYQLFKGDVVKFGESTREYVLLAENTGTK
jgi:smad nuclear-interacting protein 1